MVKNILVKYWPWFIITFLYWVLAFSAIHDEYRDYGGDSEQYIMIAESALAGKGYVMSNYPGSPVSFLYPPVFPTLLMPVLYFFGRNFYAMYLLNAVFGFGALLLGYRLFKELAGPRAAYLAVLCTAVNWYYATYAFSFIRSEIPYVFFSFLVLWCVWRYQRGPTVSAAWWLAGALLFAYFTRYVAVTLVGAVAIALFYSPIDRRKAAFPLLVFFIPFGVWNIWKMLYKTYTVSQVGLMFSEGNYALRIANSIAYYTDHITRMIYSSMVNTDITIIYVFLALATIAFTIYGFYKLFFSPLTHAMGWYVFIYFALIGLWPARESEGARFLVPVIPFVFLYFFHGIDTVKASLFLKRSFLFFAVFCCLASTPFTILEYSLPQHIPAALAEYKKASLWLKSNGSASDVVMARKPTVTSFYSGKKAIIFPHTSDPLKMWHEIDANGVKYIIVDAITKDAQDYLVPAVMEHTERIKPVCVFPSALIFEVLPKPAGS